MATETESPSPPRSRIRLWFSRLLLAFGAPAVLLCLAECGLRVAGAGYPSAFVIPDPHDESMLIDNYRFAWRFFPMALARSPQPFRVEADKPDNTVRIVVLGGSAAMGDPDPAYGLPRMLEQLLRDRHPERNFEIINAAVTAINSHVVLPIARDCLALDPDLFVVYMGNNEVNGPFGAAAVFGKSGVPLPVVRSGLAFKRTRTGQVLSNLLQGNDSNIPANWGGMKMFLDQQIQEGDPQLERVYANFESNYRALLEISESAGVPVLFSTVAVNLADSPPFSSIPRDPDGLAHARQAAHDEDWEGLAKVASAIVDNSPQHAEAHYLAGLAQLRMGKVEIAKESFIRARDLDTLRFRADSRVNGIIRSLGSTYQLFADSEAHLASMSATGIPGSESFFEHVHLTPRGNHALAIFLARQSEAVLELGKPNDNWQPFHECMAALGSSAFHQRELLREVRRRMAAPPFTNRFGNTERLAEIDRVIVAAGAQLTDTAAEEAIESFRSLLSERPDDWQTRIKFAILLDSIGKLEMALDQRQWIADQLSHDASANSELGSALNRVHKWLGAEKALRRAIAIREQHPRAWNSLGICLSRQPSRLEEAKESFARATALRPDYAEAYHNLGLVLGKEGALEEAVSQFRSATRADPHYAPALQGMGQALVKLNQFEEATATYARLTELLPANPTAHLNHALACLRVQGHRAAAIQSFRTALKLDPGNPIATRALSEMGLEQ